MLNLQSNSGASYIRFMAQTKTWENSSKEVITLDTMVMDMDSVRTESRSITIVSSVITSFELFSQVLV